MRNTLFIFCLGLLFTACDDGDIITINLDFEDNLQHCGDLVFYKTKSDPPESLSLKINNETFTSLILTNPVSDGSLLVELTNEPLTVAIGSANTFNYRTYSSLPTNPFCNDIPPSNLNITSDAQATSGEAIVTTTLIEDDNDGIPAANEDDNLDGDNNPATNPTDTDGDGLPNYLDADDDGDNVLTRNEDDNLDGDNNPFTNSIDTDTDGTPNYLDTDDDGDGVLTRDEENISQNQNPNDDVTNTDVGPDYLNAAVNTVVPATANRAHTINQTFEIRIDCTGIQLPNITQQILFFGIETYTPSSPRTVTPAFN